MLIVDESAVANGYVDGIDDCSRRIARRIRARRAIRRAGHRAGRVVGRRGSRAGARRCPGRSSIGVGGGSALDTAKQAAVVAAAAMGVEHYALGANPLPGHRPMIAIPTTAGTGAEVTRTCIVTDRAGRKVWTWGDELLPDLVVLDPASTVTMPAHVTAATGLDAFVHALEAVSGRRSHRARDRSGTARPAARRSTTSRSPSPIPTDLDARQAMQEAALLAGLAIDGGGTGIAHSIGHALGTLAHVPHGVAVAIGLAAALDWNVAGAPEAYTSAGGRARPSGRRAPGPARRAPGGGRVVDRAIRRLPELELEPDQLAAAMVAEENLPMYRNNCRARRRRRAASARRAHARGLERPAERRGDGPAVSAITRIEISHHQLPLDPPFPAAWDTRPRTRFPATIVRIHDDAGHVGVGSGDAMYGFADFERHFIGEDPLDLDRHAAVLANIEFHAGRPWPFDVALWDLAGHIHDRAGVVADRRARVAHPRLRLVRRPPTDPRDGRARPHRRRRWDSRR